MSNKRLIEVLKDHLSDEDVIFVAQEAERQEKGRWRQYKNTRCETFKMALCYLLDPKKTLPEYKEFYNKLFNQ
jgi:hypothetical protein